MLYSKPLNAIKPNDLMGLIGSIEGSRIEFKEKLGEIVEFCGDMAAFANYQGGDIVIGVKEGAGEQKGMALAVPGIANNKLDGTMDSIKNGADSRIEPRIVPAMERYSITADTSCIIVRVARSHERPHALRLAPGEYKFPLRNNNGNTYMDMSQLRNVFMNSGEVASRIREWKDARVIGPAMHPENFRYNNHAGRIMIHLVPLAAFDGGNQIDVRGVIKWTGLDSLFDFWGTQRGYNLDGVLVHRSTDSKWRYAQVYHNGIIEAVDADYIPLSNRVLILPHLEEYLVQKISNLVEAAAILEVEMPIYVFVTLVGVNEVRLTRENGSQYVESAHFDRPMVALQELQVDGWVAKPKKYLRPLLDALCQAGGLESSPSYGANGRWVPDMVL